MGAVVAALGEQVVFAAGPDDHHVLDPVLAVEGVARRARPLDAVRRGGVAEHAQTIRGPIVAGVPELVDPALAQNPAPLADLRVPLARLGRKDRFLAVRNKSHQFSRKLLAERWFSLLR